MRRLDPDAGQAPGSGGGGIRPQGSYPFSITQVGPHFEQPLPSQFVQDTITGQPEILPWGKTYADVVAGNVVGFPAYRTGPPPPNLSYIVTASGFTWTQDPENAQFVFSRVPPGNPPNYFPGGGLYESYKGRADANYWVPDYSPTGAFPSQHPADAVKNLQLFSPGSPFIECFDAYSGEALCPTPAYPKGPPRVGMTPGSSGGLPIPPGLPNVDYGDQGTPDATPQETRTLSPLVLVVGLLVLFVLIGGRS